MSAHKDPSAKPSFLYTNLYRLHKTTQDEEKARLRIEAKPYTPPQFDRAINQLEQAESKLKFLLDELNRLLGKKSS